MDSIVPVQDLFEGQFRFAVWIDRTRRRRFIDWQPLGESKNRAGRGKNDPLQMLFRKYFDGSRIDSPTSAFAAKCITASRRALDSAAWICARSANSP